MKGIILAGGSGTRLYPITKGISKQLLPIYDKPMIYYPLSVLMLAGIREILVITNPEYIENYRALLGDGSQWGISLSYAPQPKPRGLAEALIIGEEFLNGDSVCLVLGDNIFYGSGFTGLLRKSRRIVEEENQAVIFGYYVQNPEAYGVVEFDRKGRVTRLVEKPTVPKSHYAVVGLYFYPPDAPEKGKKVTPSWRGELEITSVNQLYLEEGRLKAKLIGRGFAWLDTGTHENLIEAGMFVRTIEKRQGLKIACLEEIAYLQNWITREQLLKIGKELRKSGYGEYLLKIAEEEAWDGKTAKN
ncbi:MAG: glucose-1-phosphate thymidylyltransferase RfbA [Campylobacterales bacterium]